MNRRRLWRYVSSALIIALALALTGGFSALAQNSSLNLRVSKVGKKFITVRWDHVEPGAYYGVSYKRSGSSSAGYQFVGGTSGSKFTISGLQRRATYRIEVAGGNFSASVTASTLRESNEPSGYTPPPVTCPHLPPRIVVTGYVENTQCQMVDEAGIGRMDLIERGFIDAVDVWKYVNGGLEVCISGDGWLVFLDADYMPRMATELEHIHRDGMTCGSVDRAGTVVLLASGPPANIPGTPLLTQPLTQTRQEEESLPVFDSIPLDDCQIKLVETLYLRNTPGGDIIGLVWLNSEVPAFEINGYWYKVEFEGKTGYISRYHREVLRGGCG